MQELGYSSWIYQESLKALAKVLRSHIMSGFGIELLPWRSWSWTPSSCGWVKLSLAKLF